jgi:hypothetical protein
MKAVNKVKYYIVNCKSAGAVRQSWDEFFKKMSILVRL